MSKKETPQSALEKLTTRTQKVAAAEMHIRKERKGLKTRFTEALSFIKENGKATSFAYREQTITDYRTDSIDTANGIIYLTHQDNNFSGKTIKIFGIFDIQGANAEQELFTLTMFPNNPADQSVHIRTGGKVVKGHKKRQQVSDAFKEIMASYKTKDTPSQETVEKIVFEAEEHKRKKELKKKKKK